MFTHAYDRERGLMVSVLSGGANTDADHQANVDATLLLGTDSPSRVEGNVIVQVVDRGNPQPSAAWRQKYAELNGRPNCVRRIFVLVTDSTIIRGVLTSVQWLSPAPRPHVVAARATLAEAIALAEELRGEKLPELAGLYAKARAQIAERTAT